MEFKFKELINIEKDKARKAENKKSKNLIILRLQKGSEIQILKFFSYMLAFILKLKFFMLIFSEISENGRIISMV